MTRLFSIGRMAMAALAAGCLALGACASSTPYQRVANGGVAGGYSDVQLTPGHFRVTFSGNTFTSRDTVEGYLLFRAAELTIEQGGTWFRIDDRAMEHHVRTDVRPDPLYRPWYGPYYGYWAPNWRYYGRGYGWAVWQPYGVDPFWASRVDARTVERFEASADISLGNGPRPAEDPRAFDAREVMQRLGPTVQRPQS